MYGFWIWWNLIWVRLTCRLFKQLLQSATWLWPLASCAWALARHTNLTLIDDLNANQSYFLLAISFISSTPSLLSISRSRLLLTFSNTPCPRPNLHSRRSRYRLSHNPSHGLWWDPHEPQRIHLHFSLDAQQSRPCPKTGLEGGLRAARLHHPGLDLFSILC